MPTPVQNGSWRLATGSTCSSRPTRRPPWSARSWRAQRMSRQRVGSSRAVCETTTRCPARCSLSVVQAAARPHRPASGSSCGTRCTWIRRRTHGCVGGRDRHSGGEAHQPDAACGPGPGRGRRRDAGTPGTARGSSTTRNGALELFAAFNVHEGTVAGCVGRLDLRQTPWLRPPGRAGGGVQVVAPQRGGGRLPVALVVGHRTALASSTWSCGAGSPAREVAWRVSA